MKYDFLDPEALSRLGAIPLEARQAMTGNVAGRHRSPHRGSSVEFAEYRKYVQGDDTRRLDWKAYARSDRYYIKEFEADTNLRAYFVLDASGSMGFSAADDARIQFARKLAATLSYLIIDQGDAAGLSVCQEKIHVEIPPTRRPAHLNHMFEVLANTEPTGETGLVEALHTIAEKVAQRALVIILSDLFCDTNALGDALQHLRYRKHDVAVFHMLDKQEIAFDFERPHRFVDMEDKTSIVAEPTLVADEYREAMKEFMATVKGKCHDIHADYHLITTDQDYEEIVHDFLTSRLTKKGKA
ncbi:DUF58 domain-containing protein [Verrucomicrobiaceae bacterium R5-34]|uniref:DUF58 domain-containing protein n=1 Tax=Oceaniferula flava TaxID=2800421 RepID=A0AAE2SE21_9BACT|nr:DUF58 domain-containing protein [Oceaniferula flavus]MBK1831853.1 DUF58 domain-containing protein [Verrucomicrobiaceae bacterium R5-34]MBK1856178.1 DUF58 domain-containing protein [Oceaniferula flavus]MBM1137485.1 DUF58 domain-containing protein [Oceaniferula flavus]